MTDKKILRPQIRQKISEFSVEYLKKSDEQICENLIKTAQFTLAPSVFIYYSVGREVSTQRIISECFRMDKRVALPVTLGGGEMFFADIKSENPALMPGALGIPQPGSDADAVTAALKDIILVPALCYDKNRYRLGQGGGYYDRYLPGCAAYKIGLAREKLLLDSIPVQNHDVPVDMLITDQA